MRAIRHIAAVTTVAAILLALGLAIVAALRGHPQDLPWTRLDLADPIGLTTGRKLAGLTQDFPECEALLRRAGIRFTPIAPVDAGQCSYADGVRLDPGGARRIVFSPAGLGMSCPVAAAMSVWEWDVVEPTALRLFGQRVTEFEHYGSYNCRRIAGREGGSWSEHASANAIDIAGFRLADGRRITVAGDWRGHGTKATFLRQVRNGACRLFSTTLSPDYNAAHRDHLHLDQAARGQYGWRACR